MFLYQKPSKFSLSFYSSHRIQGSFSAIKKSLSLFIQHLFCINHDGKCFISSPLLNPMAYSQQLQSFICCSVCFIGGKQERHVTNVSTQSQFIKYMLQISIYVNRNNLIHRYKINPNPPKKRVLNKNSPFHHLS